MRKRRKQNLVLILIIFVLSLGIGYAYLSTTLNINGTTDIDSNTWNVYWDNVQVTTGSVTGDQVIQAPTISNQITVSYHIRLKEPGEYYEFTIDAKNTGSIDAMIGTINSTINNGNTIPTYLKYEVTYSDGIAIEDNHLLAANTTESYRVRIEYRTDIASGDLPNSPQSLRIRLMINYIQSTTSAKLVQRPESFENDSWGTIISAVKSGNTSKYNIGDTKEIDLGDLGVHTLRIANKSTPAECNQEGFSQTACGFVLEFTDVVLNSKMHNTDTLVYWANTTLRSYLNNSFLDEMPEVIKNNIIDTYALSGRNSTLYVSTTDKIYLFCHLELFGTIGFRDPLTTAETRQLDYYANVSDPSNLSTYVIKKYNNSSTGWWLRSNNLDYQNGFGMIKTNGAYDAYGCDKTLGVSPAFRLG